MSNVTSLAIAAKTDTTQLYALWLAVERLIGSWAFRYVKNRETRLYDADDLIQSGYLALADAVRGYDPDKDTEFATYLYYHVRRRFAEVSGHRGTKTRPELGAVSLDIPLDSETDATRLDTLVDPGAEFTDDVIERESVRQDYAAVLTEIDKLNDHYRNALLYTAYEGISYREAAERMNVSKERVRQCRNAASQKIRHTTVGRQLARDYSWRHVSLSKYRSSFTSEQEHYLLWLERMTESGVSHD